MENLQLSGLNHKEANCIPRELVRYSSDTRPYFFTMHFGKGHHQHDLVVHSIDIHFIFEDLIFMDDLAYGIRGVENGGS